MPLAVSSSLGAYQILGPLGAGGMGDVYRARDTKLGRDVALKLLSGRFIDDADCLARFRREAQVLAALNHPHIAAIYGIDDVNGTQFLILELVDGESLDRHIARGPIPLDRALEIAEQIADALDAAHQQGVIHRDLKPANIALTKDGVVKILDFGLAKAVAQPANVPPDAVSATTITSPALMTSVGVILGTAAYMSPEQARGLPADRRSDIWSFGCILYEMLTGRRLFAAETVTDTLAAVLTREPVWERIPHRARRLLRQCLERDPKRRLRDIGDARLLLEPTQAGTAKTLKLPWTVAVGAIVSALITLLLLWPSTVDRQLIRLPIDLGTGGPTALVNAAISPDGTRLVFYARDAGGRRLLATRRLAESEATLLIGTEGADQPFFSPDAEWIGFFAGTKLMKVSVRGGTPIELGGARNPRGASWGDDGKIVAALSNLSGLSELPAEGGEPRPLTRLSEGELTHRWPQVLPDAKAVVFTASASTLNSYEDATIDVQSLESGERKTLWRGGYFGRYLPSSRGRGHLVYVRRGALFAVPFDPRRLEIEGTPFPVLEDVAADPESAAGRFDFSRTGSFIYQTGAGDRLWSITWLDGGGNTVPLLAKPGLYFSPRFSPDGQRLAVGIDGGKGTDIFIYDWQRDVMTKLTFTGGANGDPVWSPDGTHVLFRSYAGIRALWWVRIDGAGEPVRLLDVDADNLGPNSLSPDGRVLIYSAARDDGSHDLWTASLDLRDVDHPTLGKPEPFLDSPFDETRPAFSPDGRWVAYTSDESGTPEVWVRAFSATASRGKWQVSTGGGNQPVWSRNGRELFFLSSGQAMVSGYHTAGDSFVAGKPRIWSSTEIVGTGFSNYDLAPDGRRLAIFHRPGVRDGDATPRLTLLLNFFDELRRVSRRN